MGFIQLVFLEGILLLSAGVIFFGGIRGIIAAFAFLSGINVVTHAVGEFWYREMPLLIGGSTGIILLLVIGRMANKSKVVGGLVGGLISLVLFGAFVTPVAALIFWVLIVGTGLIPAYRKGQVLWSFAPAILRLVLGLSLVIYGNILTI